MPPGSLVFTGEQMVDKAVITVFEYNKDHLQEHRLNKVQEAFQVNDKPETVSWINIQGLHDVGIIEATGIHFGLNKLLLEDILSISQRPKFDEYEDCVFVVAKMLNWNVATRSMEDEQVSFILGKDYLISFQEKEGDVFEYVRERLRSTKGQIRVRGTDYLLYALLDAIVDHYFIILEHTGDMIEELESKMLNHPTPEVMSEVYKLRREIINLRRSVYPLREVVTKFERLEGVFLKDENRIYLRDLYDHTIQVIENIEVFRDASSGMLELYMSSISNKMNSIMKVLTIIATIFIPLTFIAGVYGMNFENMPELEWDWAYYATLLLMFMIGAGMLLFFKKNKWI